MPAFQPKHIALVALSGLAISTGAVAQPVSSRVFCRAESISRGAKVMQDAYTNAWLDVGNYVCGAQAKEPTITNIDTQVQDIALAIAEAFAEVSINCQAEGNAEVRAMGYSFAVQRAQALGTAVTRIFATADVCNLCSASINAISETSMVLISEAVAEAWTELYLFSDEGSTVDVLSEVTSNVINETIATVLSGISGVIRTGADDGCSADIITSASVGDFLARCNLAVSGDVRMISVDAITDAGAQARAYACDGDIAEAQLDVTARATARALAEAIAQTDLFCETRGGEDTMACGLAQVDVEAVAMAQAEAFASAFALAETCNCNVSSEAAVRAFSEIWVEAVANAYVETCVSGNDYEFLRSFDMELAERTVTATSRAIATAVADASLEDGNGCRTSANPCAHTSELCVPNRGRCGGTSPDSDGTLFDNVLPCCDLEYRCTVRNDRAFFCQHRNFRPPSFWDGRIEECTLGLAE